jgi:hypothetical protein
MRALDRLATAACVGPGEQALAHRSGDVGAVVVEVGEFARVAGDVEQLPGAAAHVVDELVRRRIEGLLLGGEDPVGRDLSVEVVAPPARHERGGDGASSAGTRLRPDDGRRRARGQRS